MAKGEILAILNVDDYYEPNVLNKIEKIFTTLPEPSLLVGNCNIWDSGDNLKAVNKPSKLHIKEAILWGLKNTEAMKKMAINAAERVKDFSEEKMIDQTLKIIKNMTN